MDMDPKIAKPDPNAERTAAVIDSARALMAGAPVVTGFLLLFDVGGKIECRIMGTSQALCHMVMIAQNNINARLMRGSEIEHDGTLEAPT